MAIDAIRDASAIGGIVPKIELGERSAPSTGFAEELAQKLGDVDRLQQNADRAISEFIDSGGEGLTEAVVAMEKASLGLEAVLRVRGKVLEAYQEIMRMQV